MPWGVDRADTTGMLRTRPVTAGDVEFLWSMLFWAAHADEQHGATHASIRSDPDLTRYLAGWGRDGDLGRVALDGEVPVGAAWLRRFTPDEAHLPTFVDADTPELAIAVEPTRIGQGIGSVLLRALLTEADTAEVPAIVLSARSDNPAVRLYGRLGFVETGRIVNRVGTESIMMLRHRPC